MASSADFRTKGFLSFVSLDKSSRASFPPICPSTSAAVFRTSTFGSLSTISICLTEKGFFFSPNIFKILFLTYQGGLFSF